MTLDERIAEAEREMAEAMDDYKHAIKDSDAIWRARILPALTRRTGWHAELARLRALKSGEGREGER